MAVNYNVAVKTARITATRDYFADGTLELLAGATVVATFGLSASGGTIAGDTWTLTFDAATVAAGNAGNIDGAQIKNAGGSAHITGLTVGTAGTDVIVDNTSVNAGQNITISSASIQHA
ncbi:MAG: hypothetical protein LPK02_06925 [Rhodobacterales bacterium]|nr:hypothetical protein [Rhodobacterales bacterium]